MKKIFCLILCFMLSGFMAFSVSATSGCTIVGEMEGITYNEKNFVELESNNLLLIGEEYVPLDYKFESSNFEKHVDYIGVGMYKDCDYIIEASVEYGSVSRTVYYVREDKQEWANSFVKGNDASFMVTENTNAYVYKYLDEQKVSEWVDDKNAVIVSEKQLRFYTNHPVYITDSSKALRLQVGFVYENGEDYYFVKYSDYDNSSLYEDGSIAELNKAYKLGDNEYKNALKEIYSENALEEVNETAAESYQDFDNILNGVSELSLIVVIGLLFVLIPIAAIIISLILIYAKHVSYHYRGWLMAITIVAFAVLLCAVSFVLLIII